LREHSDAASGLREYGFTMDTVCARARALQRR
jgi:hypothetical protein